MTDLPELPNYAAGTWHVDNVNSYVGFTIKHMMVSKVRGRFTYTVLSTGTGDVIGSVYIYPASGHEPGGAEGRTQASVQSWVRAEWPPAEDYALHGSA